MRVKPQIKAQFVMCYCSYSGASNTDIIGITTSNINFARRLSANNSVSTDVITRETKDEKYNSKLEWFHIAWVSINLRNLYSSQNIRSTLQYQITSFFQFLYNIFVMTQFSLEIVANFCTQDGGSTFLRYVVYIVPNDTTSHIRSPHFVHEFVGFIYNTMPLRVSNRPQLNKVGLKTLSVTSRNIARNFVMALKLSLICNESW
jgi:hypothetical protein